MTAYAQQERRALCDLLVEVGPTAPTLCAGWSTGDLAAHLVLRERRLDAAPGIVVPALRAYTERVQRELRARPWAELVATIRGGPPLLLRPLDDGVNTVELFVHHEDVRRAGRTWHPRELEPGLQAALWRRMQVLSLLARRRVPGGTVLEAPGHGRVTVRSGEPAVTVTGPPAELLLFMVGRQRAARVETSGPDDAVRRLQEASLGL